MGAEGMEGGEKEGRGGRKHRWGDCCVRAESKEEYASQRGLCGDAEAEVQGCW